MQEIKGWWLYHGAEVQKFQYDVTARKLVLAPFVDGATGLAFFNEPFAEGVERFVYRCTEIDASPQGNVTPLRLSLRSSLFSLSSPGEKSAPRVGRRLVAKEAKHEQNLGELFQTSMAKVQGEAGAFAILFNRIAQAPAAMQLNFLPVWIYRCTGPFSASYPEGVAWELVESELEGRFTKWNNNNGEVIHVKMQGEVSAATGRLDLSGSQAILEEDEGDGWSDDSSVDLDDFALRLNVDEAVHAPSTAVQLNEVPQCFSHFTYHFSTSKQLVCDLQGVWNSTDGFMLTDPVIHYIASNGKRHCNGATDKGARGVLNFFKTHTCGALCRQLGLVKPPLAPLIKAADDEKARQCVVCVSELRSVRFLPCRHACCCETCASRLKEGQYRCPLCRQSILGIAERGEYLALESTLQ